MSYIEFVYIFVSFVLSLFIPVLCIIIKFLVNVLHKFLMIPNLRKKEI